MTDGGRLRPHVPVLLELVQIADGLTGAGLFFGMHLLYAPETPYYAEASALIFFVCVFCFRTVGLYRSWRVTPIYKECENILSGCVLCYLCLACINYFLRLYDGPLSIFSGWMIVFPGILISERVCYRILLRYYRTRGYNVKWAVIAGTSDAGRQLARLLSQNLWSGVRVQGFFDDASGRIELDGLPLLGKLSEVPDYVRENVTDTVYIALSMVEQQKIKCLLKELSDTTTTVYLIPDLFLVDICICSNLFFFENVPLIALRESPLLGLNGLLKKAEDIILSGTILALSSPLMLLIALAIKINSRGPVLFKQWRYGLSGQSIKVYKFRTMTVCNDGYEYDQATCSDPRVTAVGRFLRRTSLDELPQFINVLQGRMSIVGPRPHPVAMNEKYRKLVPGYMLRYKVKPGISGLAQINGWRGETDTLEKMQKRIEYDLEYMRRWSIWLDLKIILKTIIACLSGKNAY